MLPMHPLRAQDFAVYLEFVGQASAHPAEPLRRRNDIGNKCRIARFELAQ